MASMDLGRRAFVEALGAVPFGGSALSAQTSTPPVNKIAAGSGRANDIITLPGATAFTSGWQPKTALGRSS